MKLYSQRAILSVIFCLLSLFLGCDNDSSSNSLIVLPLENGVLIQTGSDVRRFEVNNGIAYLVKADGLIQVIDISNNHCPKLIDNFTVSPKADIAFEDGLLYVLGNGNLHIFNASDPYAIKHQQDIELQMYNNSLRSGSLAVHQGRIFIVLLEVFQHGPPFSTFYAMDAAHPKEIASYSLDNADKIIGVDGDIVYTQRYADISKVDVSDLNSIQSASVHLNTIDPLESIAKNQTVYYIHQTGASDFPLALGIADTATPSDPSSVPSVYLPFTGKTDRGVTVYPKSLAIQNNTVYVALISGELMAFDVRVPDQPKWIKRIDYQIVDPIDIPEIKFRDMRIIGDTAFIGCSKGLVIIDINDSENNSTAQIGVFIDSPVAGLGYETPSRQGTTDINGNFSYQSEETITFSVGGSPLGSSPGKAIITPVDLVPDALDETHPIVTNITRLLLSLDSDCDPSNGIFISQAIRDEMQGRKIDVSADFDVFKNEVEFALSALNGRNLFACGDVKLWSVESAQRHLRTTLKGKPQFKLTIKEGQHCSVTIDPYKVFYNEGEAVRLTLVPESGWKFKNWLGDANPYENPTTVTMNSDRTIVAIPETVIPESFQVPVVLRITESGSGTVIANPPGGTYHADPHGYINQNLVVSLTGKPDPGWVFGHWETDISSTDNPETIVIDGYKNITAVFNSLPPNQHTLHTDHTGMGGIQLDPPGGIYYTGVPVMVTAIPDAGWGFAGWDGDLKGDDISQTLTMNSNYQITAEFMELPGERFTLTAKADRGTVVNFWPPADELIHNGDIIIASYKPGTEVTLTAVTRPGYIFIEWGGDLFGSQNPQHLTMDGNKSILLFSEFRPL